MTQDAFSSLHEVSCARGNELLCISIADAADREEIYRLRHEVYARELGQHQTNPGAFLRDCLDEGNTYLVGKIAGRMAGFISITPPELKQYSIDKYFARDELPFPVDDGLFEIRLLTVRKSHRGGDLALLLMYGALRWVESRGGSSVMVIGRREILSLYLKTGLKPLQMSTQSGRVTYDLLHANLTEIKASLSQFSSLLTRLERKTKWDLEFPFRARAQCFHGGRFFEAIGVRFDALARKNDIINADVLDAWFAPSPRALAVIQEHLPWLMRTSPPTGCEGLLQEIALARRIQPGNLLPGSGSSDLIFRVFRQWLSRSSRVLILDPCYSEYAHVLEQVIGCAVDRFRLHRGNNYDLNLQTLREELSRGYDLVVLVNPNSPTGRHVPRNELEEFLRSVPPSTRVWVDETYIDYLGKEESVERFAATSGNVVVCKSMSKVYALSGLRVAYLCGKSETIEPLRVVTPPWVVGLPAQVSAAFALQDESYYAARYTETHTLREQLARGLEALGCKVVPGCANFLLAHLPETAPETGEVLRRCEARDLFVRDASSMGSALGRAVRIAVKDEGTNQRMLEILGSALH